MLRVFAQVAQSLGCLPSCPIHSTRYLPRPPTPWKLYMSCPPPIQTLKKLRSSWPAKNRYSRNPTRRLPNSASSKHYLVSLSIRRKPLHIFKTITLLYLRCKLSMSHHPPGPHTCPRYPPLPRLPPLSIQTLKQSESANVVQ